MPHAAPHFCNCGPYPNPDTQPARHPNYYSWVRTWGKRIAEEENSAWLAHQDRLEARHG